MDIINRALEEQAAASKSLVDKPEKLRNFAMQLVDVFNHGGKLLIAGNGRMGAVANLVANTFLHRLNLERPSLPAYSLSHDITLSQTLDRDGLDSQIFVRPFRALASEGDILLIFSDLPPNKALDELLTIANEEEYQTAGVLPQKGTLLSIEPDFLFSFPTTSSARATESALFFGNLLCEMVESELFGIYR